MIYVLTGDNYAALMARRLELTAGCTQEIERIDAGQLSSQELHERLVAKSLFTSERCIILEQAASVSDTWQRLGEVVGEIDGGTTLIIIESSIDKRSKTYKLLQKIATIEQFEMTPESQESHVVARALAFAKTQSATLTKQQIKILCERSLIPSGQPGKRVYDETRIRRAVEALSSSREITEAMIDAVAPPAPYANVFELFKALLTAPREARQMCEQLKLGEEPYMVLGLLAGQLQQFAALVLGGTTPQAKVASDMGSSPYMLRRLAPLAGGYPRQDLPRLIDAFARADSRLKSSATDPWQVVESLIYEIDHIHNHK